MYVDESAFRASCEHGRLVRVPRETRRRVSDYVRKSGRISVSVFGCLCCDELFPLYVVHGTFRQELYCDVLQELYIPVLLEKFNVVQWRFMQDNSPVHTSRVVRKFIEEEAPEEIREAWHFFPPVHFDLNPIEQVRACVKNTTRGKNFRTEPELVSGIMEAWREVGQDSAFLQALTASVFRRINAVQESGGGETKY